MPKASLKQLRGQVVPLVGHGFATGEPVYQLGDNYLLANASNVATTAEYVVEVLDSDTFVLTIPQQDLEVTVAGLMEAGHPALNFPADIGLPLYVSVTETGKYTTTQPTTGVSNSVATIQSANSIRVRVNASAVISSSGGAGVTNFVGLTDTPATLGTAGQQLRVNAAGDALEFITPTTSALLVQNIAADTVWSNQDGFIVDASGNAVTVTIDPAILDRRLSVFALDVTNAVTMTASSGVIIGLGDATGTVSKTISPATDSRTLISDGTNLYIS